MKIKEAITVVCREVYRGDSWFSLPEEFSHNPAEEVRTIVQKNDVIVSESMQSFLTE